MSTKTLPFVFLWVMKYVYMREMFAKDESKQRLNKLLQFSSTEVDFCEFFFSKVNAC